MSIYKLIDIEKNGVIEASAGTGKTYTVENLIIRIIKEKKILIDEMLVVTFTEKAAGELRTRIREIIEKEIKECADFSEEKEFFEVCLSNLGKAMIGTIHGFCNSVLKNFAFESQSSFEQELVSGKFIINKAITMAIRNEIAEMFRSNFGSVEEFFELDDIIAKAKEILQKFRPDTDFFKPNITESSVELFHKIKEKSAEGDSHNKEFDQCLEDAKKIKKGNFSEKGKKLHEAITVKTRDELFKMLKRKDRKLLKESVKKLLSDDEEILAKAEESLMDLARKICECGKEQEILRNKFELKIVQEIVKSTYRRVVEIKNEYSLLTYDDMIVTIAVALNEENSPLANILSAKYKYCIIDEFQDTSPQQWSIFKKIFLRKNNLHEQKNKIYIVGDPKQSIYSFQGSDLNSYYEAKKSILESYGGKFYTLKQNFRSHSDIIDVCNKIFSSNCYIGQSGLDKEIWSDFIEAEYGDGSKQKEMSEKSGARVTVYKYCIEEKERKEVSKALFYRAIASEIVNIKHDFKRLSDIAVLTGTNREADNIRSVLIKHGISSVKYKQVGFFQSDFMREFILVLDAVCFPTNIVKVKQALCTNFFFGGVDWAKLEDVSQYIEIFYELKTESVEKNWAQFFSTLSYSSNFNNNVSKLNRSDRDLREAFLRQTIKFCISFLRKNSSLLEELLEKLKNYLDGIEEPPEGEDCFEAPTQKNAVQVMTIHASKGLQFSAVFVCFEPDDSDKLKAIYPMFVNTAGGERAVVINSKIDGLNSDSYSAMYRSEKIAENKRLYYVALTRACEKLYLFIPEHSGEKSLAGLAVESAIKTINRESAAIEIKIGHNHDFLTEKREVYFDQPNEKDETEKHIDETIEKSYDWIIKRKTYIHSYSSIVRKLTNKVTEAVDFFYDEPKQQDNSTIAELTELGDSGYLTPSSLGIKMGHNKTLEPGSEAGNILHEVFEEMDFYDISRFGNEDGLEKDKNFCDIVERVLASYSKDFGYKSHIASIVYNSLNAIIEIDGESFTLGEIKMENSVREMEFYYCDLTSKNSILKGYIDLVFFHNGKYYILDWKSNVLDSYSEEKIVESMERSGYFIQANLYANAFKKWLADRVEKFSYEDDFGGITYVYLRGTEEGTSKGIYTFKPTEKSVEAFTESIMPH